MKVYIDSLPTSLMKGSEYAYEDRFRDILEIAKEIERLTRDIEARTEGNGTESD